jgi:hypothetical protein
MDAFTLRVSCPTQLTDQDCFPVFITLAPAVLWQCRIDSRMLTGRVDAADFTSYSGQQQNWPTQPGSFVATKYVIPAYIHSWPDRPYIVLGYLNATTAPIRQRGAVSFASRNGLLSIDEMESACVAH